MRLYRRRLPHQDIPGVPVFLTWRLSGSLPPERVFHRESLNSGEAFAAFDRLLDAGSGPLFLRQPVIAEIVADQIRTGGDSGSYSVSAFVVMPNHVHLLCTPQSSLPELVQRIKGPTARRANLLLGRERKQFWQSEYFDRTVRDPTEFDKIANYIEWKDRKSTRLNSSHRT